MASLKWISLFAISPSSAASVIFAFHHSYLDHLPDYAKRRMTADEAVDVQKLLKDASQELTSEQVLRVLRRSILLYFKVCLFPYPPPTVDQLPGPEGKLKLLKTEM